MNIHRGYRIYGRKSVDKSAKTEQVLLATGEISSIDKSLLTQLLGRFGIESQFVSSDEYYQTRSRWLAAAAIVANPESITQNPYSFLSINSPEQYLVREHFENLRGVRPNIFKGGATSVGSFYNLLVDGNGPTRMRKYDPATNSYVPRDPLPYTGIEVISRDELGLGEYSGSAAKTPHNKNTDCAGFAVRAGSLVEVSQPFETQLRLTGVEELFLVISLQLQAQFGTIS